MEEFVSSLKDLFFPLASAAQEGQPAAYIGYYALYGVFILAGVAALSGAYKVYEVLKEGRKKASEKGEPRPSAGYAPVAIVGLIAVAGIFAYIGFIYSDAADEAHRDCPSSGSTVEIHGHPTKLRCVHTKFERT